MPPMPRKPPPLGSKRDPNRNLLVALVAGAAVVAAIVVGVVVLGGGSDTVDATPSAYLDGIPQSGDVLGEPQAAVTMIQFEDLQCPVCLAYTQDAQADVVNEYVRTGKAKLRFAGLAFLGPDSDKALRYTLAAGQHDKLWQYAELLYEHQGPENAGWVTDGLLEQVATALGLDWDTLKTEAASAAVTQQADSMRQEGQERQVPGTPTFYMQVGDAEPYLVSPQGFSLEAFRPIFEDALAK